MLTIKPFTEGFHKVNVSTIRITNAPILLFISLYERKYLWQRARQLTPRRLGWFASFENFGPHRDLSAVFDADPPQGQSFHIIRLWETIMAMIAHLQDVYRVCAHSLADIIDQMDDVDEILDDMWDGGDYITGLRRKRSRSVSEGSGVWNRSRYNSRANGPRRRSTREEDPGPEPEDV